MTNDSVAIKKYVARLQRASFILIETVIGIQPKLST